MNSEIAISCFLRLSTAILSATEAIYTRPDEEDKIAQSGVGGCWTAAFFAFLISIAIESRLPRVQKNIPFVIYYMYMFGACILYIGTLFFIRMPRSSDGIEGVPAENLWSGLWMFGGLILMMSQLAVVVSARRNSLPFIFVVSNSLGAMGSFLYFMSGMFSTTEFINTKVFYFTAMYDWYMKTANVWIAASTFYMVHTITLYFGLSQIDDETSSDDDGSNSTDKEHSTAKEGSV